MSDDNGVMLQRMQQVIEEAQADVREYPQMRIGQALFNRCPPQISENIRATSLDMFHTSDASKAYDMLYEAFNKYWDVD